MRLKIGLAVNQLATGNWQPVTPISTRGFGDELSVPTIIRADALDW